MIATSEYREHLPPSLSDDEVKKFQNIYKANFWIEINSQDAYQQGMKLIIFLQGIYDLEQEEKKDWKNILIT